MYKAIREAADGNIVTVEQFFRVGAKYYISTIAVTEPVLSIADIMTRPFVQRLQLCCSISHAMARIHEKGIIHTDIKPDNILVVQRNPKALQVNIIDFDCSFFEYNCPELGEELNGDMVYLSPEGFFHIAGIESNLSCKMDVFALGLLFYQYLTGSLPAFDNKEYQYAYESVLDDKELGLELIEDGYCKELIGKMLKKNPDDRPDMRSVFNLLRYLLLYMKGRTRPKLVEVSEMVQESNDRGYFEIAGNL